VHQVNKLAIVASNRQLRVAILLVGLASLLLSAFFIFRDSGIVPPHPMDQSFAETVDLHIRNNNGKLSFAYPNLQFSGGITANLVIGIYKLIVPVSHESLNWHVRIFSMVTYLVSSYALIFRFVKYDPAKLIAILLLATSGFQFIQPSSELIAGTSLSLFVLGASLRWPRLITSLFLAIFALCKVEFAVAAVAMALFWAWRDTSDTSSRGHGTKIAWGCFAFFGWISILLLPAFVLAGANPFSIDRSFLTISNTYIEFFQSHQFITISPGNLPSGPDLFAAKFPLAKSAMQFIINYPKYYIDYLGISSARSLCNTVLALKLLLVSGGLVLLNWKNLGGLKPYITLLILALAFTLLPAWLVVHVRVRYYAKVFPLIVALITAGCMEIAKKNAMAQRVFLWTSLGTIAIQIFSFKGMVEFSHYM
jgi:hypothetical protein